MRRTQKKRLVWPYNYKSMQTHRIRWQSKSQSDVIIERNLCVPTHTSASESCTDNDNNARMTINSTLRRCRKSRLSTAGTPTSTQSIRVTLGASRLNRWHTMSTHAVGSVHFARCHKLVVHQSYHQATLLNLNGAAIFVQSYSQNHRQTRFILAQPYWDTGPCNNA